MTIININNSTNFLELSDKINVIISILIVCIGLIGNTLSLIIYGQSKYRLNSSHVFIFILAIVDSLFLIVHFFEDTIRNYKKYYFLINYFNIIDTNKEICILTNYMRYVLRSISSYIILAFTFQRFIIVYSPLSNRRFKSKKYAWFICLLIIISSLLLNSWSLFVFDLTTLNNTKQCDVLFEWEYIYYYISISYFTLSILIPMILIVILNGLIIKKSKQDDLKRKKYMNSGVSSKKKSTQSKKHTKSNNSRRNALKKSIHYRIKNNKINLTHKMTKTLGLASFSFVLLNLPYSIMWYIYILFYFDI
jgi:hypothetical protein